MAKWVDRKFSFEGLEGTFGGIIERLEGTPARLESKLAGHAPETLATSQDGKWSAQVHAGHLLTLESLWLGRLDDFYGGKEILRAWNPTNEETEMADFNSQRMDSILRDFRSTRMGMVRVMRSLQGKETTLCAKHPRLGTTMRLIDMAFFIAEHDDHHLATITSILNREGE